MAKRRRRRGRRRARGVGSVITVRRLGGLGDLGKTSTAMGSMGPVLIGGGVAALTAIGIRQYMTPTTETGITVMNNAPWVGVGAGALVALALWNMVSKPAGLMAAAAAVAVGGTMVLGEYAAKMRMGAGTPAAGLRAVVPEFAMRGLPSQSPLGKIVMEPSSSRGYGAPAGLRSYGENINLGAINTSVFGTPGFSQGYR